MNYDKPLDPEAKERERINYYAKRFDFLMISTIIIFAVGVIIFSVLESKHLYDVTGSTLPVWFFDHEGTDGIWWKVSIGIFIFGLILNYIGKSPGGISFGIKKSPALSSKTSGRIIAMSIFTFILLISLPIFYLGGAKDSIYSIVLVTSCALSVALTKSLTTRISIGSVCMLIYASSAKFYVRIGISSENEFAYSVLLVFMTFVCIGISFYLSSQIKKTIFGD